METFRVRLNCIDHYQAVPLDEFDPPLPHGAAHEKARDRARISVIRVFGATETGQKVLMHIHGALQYTYIEYSGSLRGPDVECAIRTLQLSIDHALAVSYRKNVYDGHHRYVAHISLVKGVPFYGFHVGHRFYLKIYLLNPLHMNRLADLLREGAVMKRVLQPYESHLQYLAQWMCDYNLYGCAYIDCDAVKFRSPVPQFADMTNAMHRWHDRSIPAHAIADERALPKHSHCALEVDVHVKDILNRRSVEARPVHHDFIERIHPISPEAKLVQSMAGLWRDETRRRKLRMGLTDPNSRPFPPEVLISMSADPRSTSPGGWIHEQEFRDAVDRLVVEERERAASTQLDFDSFVRPVPQEAEIRTALESVDDLYPDRLYPNRLAHYQGSRGWTAPNGRDDDARDQIVTDESRAAHMTPVSDPSSEEARPPEAPDLDLDSADVAADRLPHRDVPTYEPVLEPMLEPIGPADYAKYGIRPVGNVTDLAMDALKLPPGQADRPINGQHGPKRARAAATPAFRPRKRRRQLVDEVQLLPDLELSDPESGPDPHQAVDHHAGSHPQPGKLHTSNLLGTPTSAQPIGLANGADADSCSPSLSQQSTLSFPTVKHPHELATGLRWSQTLPSSQSSSKGAAEKSAVSTTSSETAKMGSGAPARPGPASNSSSSSGFLNSPIRGWDGLRRRHHRGGVHYLRRLPPSSRQIESSMRVQGLHDVIYQEAFYSNENDVPGRAREYAGREFKLESSTVPFLPDFDPTGTSPATFGRKPPQLIDVSTEKVRDNQRRKRCTIARWAIADPPPRKDDVISWAHAEQTATRSSRGASKTKTPCNALSQIEGPAQKNAHGFKFSQKHPSTSVQHETQYMSIMSLEVHVNTRGALAPNPHEDAIACVFWCVQTDDDDFDPTDPRANLCVGAVAVASETGLVAGVGRSVSFDVEEEATELDVLMRLVDIVRLHDPDILTGYEVHNSSWGYLIERARVKYDLNYCDELSRIKTQSHGRFGKDDDRWGFNHTSTIRVTGRHTINIWRAMRGEINLLQYTLENVVYHLLHRRIPHYAFADLTRWYPSKNPRDVAKVMDYFAARVQIDIEILEANELVPRTSEQARLLGVDWFSVISRGSQFKVESLMFRIAKPENFILVSPGRRQVGGQNALECLPLIMEPQSDFYTSPMLVLDFQSLYPSVMIAYNYCYSTFLGRVVGWRGTNKMGFTDYRRPPRLLELVKDHINIAPNGIMYAKPAIRKSLLAKMLTEILETRVMVKSGMKVDKDDRTLQTLLNNRQLALKLIANVTYGYTSASFSGRMPCSEIADSIVQTGRETLEKAIAFIHSVDRWGAEVVYGDTDSLFVYLKGRTREQAFDIGEEIADAITKMNPRPVKLKFEKVYHPCVLLAKKRYVGFKYESRTQTVPDFDAKGIETVRRDGTPAEQKIEEIALKMLFRTSDLSQVKRFFQAQCAKIMRGTVSIQDFCFAKEVKLGTYSDRGPPPPGALISARKMLEDPRLEPQYGERVPYVVVTGGPGARLVDRCVAPEVLLHDAHAELDAEYYISKNLIPPLERIFNLVGANVRQWYDEMPKYQRIRRVGGPSGADGPKAGGLKKTLESYLKPSTCLVCREALDTDSRLCRGCEGQSSHTMLVLRSRIAKAEKTVKDLNNVCRSCSGLGWRDEVRCDSKDCPVFYSRIRHVTGLASEYAHILPVLSDLENHQGYDFDW